jgi:hypothetical protein
MSKSKAKQARRQPAPAPRARARAEPVSLLRLAPVFLVGAFLGAIFLLPYYVPIHGSPTSSQSWEFGFNNTAAQGLIALMLLALFAWQFFRGRAKTGGDLVYKTLLAEAREPVPVRPLLAMMGILQIITAAVVLAWYNVLPYSHYGELTYFIQRVEAVILGRTPYLDFAFDYGPAMLALPAGIYRLFHGAISVEDAYTATLIIHFTIGFALLTYVVSQVNARGRVIILAMVGIEWVNLDMGLNYTPLRFTVAAASLFAVRHLERLTRDFTTARRALLLALAGFLLPLLNFSISPEMGLALTVALCVYFFWFLFGPERRLALLALAVVAGVGATALVFPRAYFDSMLSFGKGGASFPIFPTIHILAFLAAAIWIFPRLGIIALRDKSATAPFCAAFAILCGLFILPATGRCDPGHIWINSVSILVIALAAASWLEPKWRYLLWGLYFLVFPTTQEISNWNNYKGPIRNALEVRNELAGIQYDADNYAHLAPGAMPPRIHYSKLLPMAGLDTLPRVKIGLPLGDNEMLERYLKLNNRDIPAYHIQPYGDVFDAADLEGIYRDLKSMEYIFVPSNYLGYLQPVNPVLQQRAQAEGDNKFMSGLLLFPVNLSPVHPMFQPDSDIMHRIAAEYELVKQYNNGVLLKRKD